MKTKINARKWAQRVSILVAPLAIAGVPFLNAVQPAQAAPPAHAPAHGYRNKNKSERREDRRERRQERREDRRERRQERREDRWDDRYDNRDDRYNRDRYNRDNTVEGWNDFYGTVVGGSYRSTLTVRSDNGRTYRVEGRNDFDSRINIGDRVRVEGNGRSTSVLADRVTLIENRR